MLVETPAQSGPSPHRRFVFGEFEVGLDRGSLKHRGDDVPLRPKSFAMLQYLLERAGQLVTREELLDAVWPGVVVTDDSVAQCLIEIRRALGDDQRSIVRTVPRRGLIFDVPVRIEDAPAPLEPPSRTLRYGWILAVALAGVTTLLLWWLYPQEQATPPETATAPALPTHSVAVLRFTDMSPAGDQAYLADGLSEEIMHILAQSPALRVIARASSFAVEGRPIELVAEKLGVSHVLEGSVRRQGDEIRITAQLIDAATSSHIWSRSYDRKLDDIIDVQREIAGAVAGTLEVSLADAADPADIDPTAYQLFLEGRYFYFRRLDGDMARAQERYEEAVSISPEFARAWTGLSAIFNIHLRGPESHLLTPAARERLLDRQRYATEQALRYGPNLPEAHIRACYFYYFIGDWDRSRRHFEIARSIDPDYWLVRTVLANELRVAGRIQETAEIFRREMQKDPLNMTLRENVLGELVWAGRFEDARAELERTFELVPSKADLSPFFRYHETQIQILTGDFEAAASSAQAVADELKRWQLLALAFNGLGRQTDSDQALMKIISAPVSPERAIYAAEVLAFSGASAGALEWLREIDSEWECTDGFLIQSLYYSPFLAKLNGTPTWDEYRADLLQVMHGCLLGLEIDSV